MKILIVEDNPVNAKILVAYLKSENYETVVAISGERAVKCLEADSSILLVISDIMMPEMSGLEFLQVIKSHPEWRNLPVIMCSALADLETVREAVKRGCAGYIVKPVLKQHLIRKVRDVLRGSREILKEKRKIVRHLGLSESDYEDVAATFLDMVNEVSLLVEISGTETSSGDLSVTLSNLRENAIYLGAERLADIFEGRGADKTFSDDAADILNGSFGVRLLTELHRVQEVLTDRLEDSKARHSKSESGVTL
ncbi:MAG: response regulator [Deltaproteobacteria bacterium]|nr:response regulator [Deltaproteobacteria bacterium]